MVDGWVVVLGEATLLDEGGHPPFPGGQWSGLCDAMARFGSAIEYTMGAAYAAPIAKFFKNARRSSLAMSAP